MTSPCPVCKKEISKRAQSCPHCGEPFVTGSYQPAHKKKESSPIVKFGCGFFLVLFGLAIVSYNPERYAKKERSWNAHIKCEEEILGRLKAPTSAEFSSYANSAVSEENNAYTVHLSVDAQNSFGAMIRTEYECRLKYHPAGDKWSLVGVYTR